MRAVRGASALAAAILAAAASLVVAGRYEGRQAAAQERRGLERVYDAVGRDLDGPLLSSYRTEPFDCLLYRSGDSPFALQLCFDSSGRLIEAADRRGSEPRYWSVAYRPALSHIRVGPREIEAAKRSVDARAGARTSEDG